MNSAHQRGGSAARFNLEPLEPRMMLSATPANDPYLPWGSLKLSATMGQQFTGLVAKFKTSDLGVLAGDIQGIYAQINWGDDTQPQFGTVEVQSNGVIKIFGEHTFQFDAENSQVGDVVGVALGVASATQTPAAQTVKYVDDVMTITNPNPDKNYQGGAGSAPLEFAARVTPGTDFDVPFNGQFSGDVAEETFGSASGGFSSQAYALIDWGDGTVPQYGVVQNNDNGTSLILGSHVYNAHGAYHIHVTVFDYYPGLQNSWQRVLNVKEIATYSTLIPFDGATDKTASPSAKLESSITAQDLLAAGGTSATNDLLDS